MECAGHVVFALLQWAREFLVTDSADEAEISEHTACDIYQWLREVCTTKLLQSPVVLGGPGVVVQIDESQFRHKPKVLIFFFCIITIILSIHITSATIENSIHHNEHFLWT